MRKSKKNHKKDSTLGGLIAPVDVKNILNLVDNGASKEDLAKTATGIALGKVLQGKKGNNGSGKGSPIPVKDPVTASNGLDNQSNPKHTINPPRNAGIEPKNSLNLFENSVSVNAKNQKVRYTMDDSGNIHQFMPDNTGKWHWAGSTADKRNPLILPNDVKSALKKQQGWKIK
ncbi:Uncharacterised protein [Moellerella wisconsensis]|nr:Uncharacterised protein [Moellerella wisconsensis]